MGWARRFGGFLDWLTWTPPVAAHGAVMSARARWALGAALALGCGRGGGAADVEEPAAPPPCPALGPGAGRRTPGDGVELPPPAAIFDYQLGAAYSVSADVSLVVRDRSEAPAPGAYGVCYVNAFQTQPDEAWDAERAQLVLSDANGRVEDPGWPGEYFLDISSPDGREQLLAIVGGWIEGCAASGFDAVELDNLDSFTRSRQRLSFADTAAYALGLLSIAHRVGLAVAQKNTAEESACLSALGFDFAISEECWGESECDAYTSVYGERVYDVEYDVDAFDEGCAAGRSPRPILRDHELLAPGAGHVRRQCP